ncbi:CHAT domain-containing protein [Altererythrobacter sp.]|uniref:CHAT domain-containing protein n=1 Tax=Altererythrobacter sp. TaxID=1872480 RepID=UPI003CFF0685
MRQRILCSLVMSAIVVSTVPAGFAQDRQVLQRDSFPIGDSDGALCQVQDRSIGNPARQGMFDRRWAVVCRDSARPVATLYAFRGFEGDPVDLIAPYRREKVDCGGAEQVRQCTVAGTTLPWTVLRESGDGYSYIAEGFSAYDDAIRLALRSVRENAIASGRIDIATTSITDPFAFARIQAETLQPEQALAEGYRRNLGGDYAEASAYFETLQQRLEGDQESGINPGEFLVNRALQKSNLKDFAEADRLFIEAEPLTAGDPVAERLQRNFEAIHLINQGYVEDALERARRPLSQGLQGALDEEPDIAITRPLAARLNADDDTGRLLGFVDELSLTPDERAEIIDAQGLQLQGTALRILGQREEARRALIQGYNRAVAVRDGRVVTIVRLRAQVLGELAVLAEAEGDIGKAESYLRYAIDILETRYPERRAVSGAKARLAAMLLRNGREEESLALYRDVVDGSLGKRDAATGFANQLVPYFRHLAPRVEGDPGVAADFFKALQVLVRPGVAETQAILARELSASSDEAASLFRQSTDLAREIEQVRIAWSAQSRAQETVQGNQRLAEMAARLDELESQQLQTQARLSDYPQYRVIAPRALSLPEFRAAMQPGEAYLRMAAVGGNVFMFQADRDGAKAYQVDLPESELDYLVDVIRGSISSFEGGRYVTYPFDLESSHALYRALMEPVAGELANVHHLVFEPDGAMLRLPLDLLVSDDASVARYQARQEQAGADPFDFTGVEWFGRGRAISTAVSAQAFVDARNVPGSSASREYLGLGKNQPVGDGSGIRALAVSGSDQCGWSAATWDNPISDAELMAASKVVGAGESEIITGSAFSDDALEAKADLDQFRILHFATHGLVTPPQPSCPARPALLTSFGGEQSDGLLSFDEIFDLNLDADLIILSACDTAGGASIEATRAAGVGSGGGTALDGLVRSFVGAGGRAVLASHWPAPDDFNATERLMSEMFRQGRNQTLGMALRASQGLLMDQPDTSHPYYWAGFAIIGDAARPLLTSGVPAIAQADMAAHAVQGAE